MYAFNYFPSSYEEIVGQAGIFNHGMATSLGEGKRNSNLSNSAKKKQQKKVTLFHIRLMQRSW